MTDELDLRGLSPHTKENYLAAVARLAGHYGRPPDLLSDTEIKSYLLHLIRVRGLKPNTVNVVVAALRFFFETVLGRSFTVIVPALPRMKRGVMRPQVYSIAEVERLLAAPRLHPKHRAILMTAYTAGLRVSEVCALKVEHILSGRMQIRVVSGKGGKDRYTILSERLLRELREYWKKCRPSSWLFPSQSDPARPLTTRTAQRVFDRAVKLAGLDERGGIHSLRHSFATHLLESGVELPVLQRLLGHRSLSVTAVYLHVASSRLADVRSPFDRTEPAISETKTA